MKYCVILNFQRTSKLRNILKKNVNLYRKDFVVNKQFSAADIKGGNISAY